jgi:hypothetical protein
MSCNYCGNKASSFCGGCMNSSYCGIKCQEKDWSSHQEKCIVRALIRAKPEAKPWALPKSLPGRHPSEARIMEIGPKVKTKKQKRGDDNNPLSIDNGHDLGYLRELWLDANTSKDKEKIVSNIFVLLKNRDNFYYKGKSIQDIVNDYVSAENFKKLNKSYVESEDDNEGNMSVSDETGEEERERNSLEPFPENSVDAVIYYDLNSGKFIGPLSLSGYQYVTKNGEYTRKAFNTLYMDSKGTQKSLEDAKKIREYSKDKTKILIYSK